MNIPVPSEVIQMTSAAGHKEAGRHGICITGFLTVVRSSAAFMDKASRFRAEFVFFEFEQAGIVWRL